MVPHKPRGSHDQAQIEAEGSAPHNRPKDRKASVPQTIGYRIVQINCAIRYQARPYYCDAASFGRRDDCVSGHRY
jgi:hypothetical protein